MPPEFTRARSGRELKAGDMWSIGIIAYILLCGKAPFTGRTREEILTQIGKKKIEWPSSDGHESRITISQDCKGFIDHLCAKVPTKRATASQALANTWITKTEVTTADRINSVKPETGAELALSTSPKRGTIGVNTVDAHIAGGLGLTVAASLPVQPRTHTKQLLSNMENFHNSGVLGFVCRGP